MRSTSVPRFNINTVIPDIKTVRPQDCAIIKYDTKMNGEKDRQME